MPAGRAPARLLRALAPRGKLGPNPGEVGVAVPGRLGWRSHAHPFLHKPLPLPTSRVDVTNKNLLAHSSLCGLCSQPQGTGTQLLG